MSGRPFNRLPPLVRMTPSRVVPLLASVVALVLGGALILPPAWSSPLNIDEQVTYYLVAGRTPPTVWDRAMEESATPPLYFWLAKGAWEAGYCFQDVPREFWLRLPSIGSFFVALGAIIWIGERSISMGAGGAASMALASVPLVSAEAANARPYALGLALVLVALAALLELVRPGPSFAWYVIFTMASAGLIWTHYLFALCLPGLFLAAAMLNLGGWRNGPVRLTMNSILLIVAAASALPLWPGMERLLAYGPYLEWVSQPMDSGQYWTVFQIGPLLASLAVAAGIAWSRRTKPSDFRPSWPILGSLATLSLFPAASLALAGWLVSPAISQPRYYLIAIGPMVVLAAGCWFRLAGRWAICGALVFALAAGTAQRVLLTIESSSRQDRHWLEAARLLATSARPHDLLLIYSGLVESCLVPERYPDAAFQEYTTSRLSDFYLPGEYERLALPMHPIAGSWQGEYSKRLEMARQQGRGVWLILSADSDKGQAVEEWCLAWLGQHGFTPRLVRQDRVARVWQVEP